MDDAAALCVFLSTTFTLGPPDTFQSRWLEAGTLLGRCHRLMPQYVWSLRMIPQEGLLTFEVQEKALRSLSEGE